MKSIYLLLFSLLGYFSCYAQCNDNVRSGEATFYGGVAGSSGGNCSLPVAANDFQHCALNNADYDNSNSCGACLEVTGALGKTVVKVVDRCPECKPGDVDLTEQAFSQIANPIDGRVNVSWKFVPCPLAANKTIKVNFKSGSSKYWTAIQFRDIRYAVAKMEYLKNGNWINVERKIFNFFIEPAGINSPMQLRITSVVGEQLVLNNIPINTTTDFNTNLQFSIPDACSDSPVTNPPTPTEPTPPTEPVDQSFKSHVIPGRIEAEDFDKGGQGRAYSDTNSRNNGNQYRNEGVDIQTTGDSNGNFNVGWMNSGEWLTYTVNVSETANYDILLRTASVFNTPSVQLLVDGTSVSNNITIPNTNGWQNYTTVRVPNISLAKGKHIFRINVTSSGLNLNYWSAVLSNAAAGSQKDLGFVSENKIIGFPNPATSEFKLNKSVNSWTLYTIQGAILTTGKGNSIDLSRYSKGNYFLRTGNSVLKIIKK